MHRVIFATSVFLALTCFSIFLFSLATLHQKDKDPRHVSTDNYSTNDGTEGYVIKKNNLVYFLANINFDSSEGLEEHIRQQMKREHPTDTTLSFDDKNYFKKLNTGDKLKIWYSRILESYPAKIPVEKIEILEQ